MTPPGDSGSLWSWTLADFRDRTAAATPAPGGGSVAAACATLGLSLVLMSLEITRKKAEVGPAPGLEVALEAALETGRELLASLSSHPDRDIAAVDAYMAALSLPKGGDEEKALRRRRIQEALTLATESPLAAGRDITAALDFATRTLGLCKPQVRSDFEAGVDLLTGSLSAVLRNVDVNLPGLAEGPLKERLRAERAALATVRPAG